jgi:ribose transport system ATP-binding protein
MNENNLLSVQNLTVGSNGKLILDNVALTIRRGEIHAIVGDQNSGKTFLAEVLSGLNPRYRGKISFEDRVIARHSLRKALELGIETIHEVPKVLPTLTVLENVFPIRRIKTNRIIPNESGMADLAKRKIRLFSVDIDLKSRIDRCSSDEKVIVYIARSLCNPSKLLIVNDISKRLTATQVDALHSELTSLREMGTTILYVTSNIEEVYNFADRISLFHKGKIAITQEASNLNKLELVQLSMSHLYQRTELSRMNFELFYLNNFYENIINSLPIPLLIVNTGRNISYINNSFALTITYPRRAI